MYPIKIQLPGAEHAGWGGSSALKWKNKALKKLEVYLGQRGGKALITIYFSDIIELQGGEKEYQEFKALTTDEEKTNFSWKLIWSSFTIDHFSIFRNYVFNQGRDSGESLIKKQFRDLLDL